MARKKQEISLQAEVETQEEWEEMLSKEGLTVVDAYQEWAGPCKAMVGNFRRLKNELGDDLLRFTVAKTDTIDALERYRGKCEPCFLFFAGGVLVAQVRGVNSPLLLRTITEQLAYEHKVLEGNAERKEIKDPLLADLDKGKDEEDEEEEEGERKKGVTVAIIKPNVVEDGKVDEVIEQMKAAGIDILEHEEKLMSEEQAREFYKHKEEEPFFEDLIKYMTSGPCHVLVITKGDTGEGIIDEWRDLLGPASMEEAMEKAPESLRAKYGRQESYVNALHGSDSEETAMRELAFFFPNYTVPTIPGTGKKPKIQRTLALIRPDALRERKDEILNKITEAGFKVALQKEIQLTKEQAEEFYKEHQGQEYFEELTNRMSSGPLLALGLAREDAVTGWRELLGPKELDKAKEEAPDSLRAQFAIEDVPLNQLHGSDSDETAKRELEYFFPMQQTVAVIKPDAYQTKDDIMQRIREAGFHIAARKETSLTKDIAQEFYKDLKDKDYYEELTEHMSSGPTLFMVLSREDAVEGWRSLIGPTDPSVAKEQNQDSLRAQFGTDIKANAIHGSSNPEHVKETIKLIFGDLVFRSDGAVDKEASQPSQDDQAETEEGQVQQTEQQDGEQRDGDQETEQQAEQMEGDVVGEEQQQSDQQEGDQDGQGEGGEQTTEQPAEGGEDAKSTAEGEEQQQQDDTQKADTEESAQADDKKEDATSQKGDDEKPEDKKPEAPAAAEKAESSDKAEADKGGETAEQQEASGDDGTEQKPGSGKTSPTQKAADNNIEQKAE